MSQRVVAIVQARMGSNRFPGKSLLPLQGRSLISHVLERAAAIPGVDQAALATSLAESDLLLAQEADRLGYDVFCGSEWDVLGRMARAAEVFKADVIVRITGDCPLLASDVGGRVLSWWRHDPLQPPYVSNDTELSGYPDGTDVEVFSRGWLEQTDKCATERRDREHVTPWLRRNVFTATLKCDTGDFRALKLSVDRPEDLERVRRVALLQPAGDFSFASLLEACRQCEVLV